MNGLSSELGLGRNLVKDLFVTNPSLVIKKGNDGKRFYEFSVDEISPGEVVEFLASLAGTDLPDSIESELKEIGNVSFTLSKQGISLSYLNDVTLDLNEITSTAGIGFIQDAVNEISSQLLGDGDSTKEGTQLVLSQPQLKVVKQNDTKEFSLAALLNGQEIDLNFKKDDIKFSYSLPNEIDFGSIARGIPLLSAFKLTNPELTISDVSEQINHPTLGLINLTQGFNFTGDINFAQGTDVYSRFISGQLGIDSLGVHVGLNTSTGATLTGIMAGDVPLFSSGDFSATLTNAKLNLAVDSNISPSFGIAAGISFTGYDPFQSDEPTLELTGGLTLDPKALTGSFSLNTDTAWEEPFSLPDTTVRNLVVQLGGTYLTPYIDNIGFLGDFQFGNFNLKGGFLLDTNDPSKIGLELTANEKVSLVDLIVGPVGSFVVKQGAKELTIVKDALEFLNKIIDVSVVSIDGPDEDTIIDPLIKFVPVETKNW
ncbi:hypothetical protein FJR38_09260 [Anabaena sp. UHCC 0253]|nr:hypothetical protein [Anabaena sp. UHCC 0253]